MIGDPYPGNTNNTEFTSTSVPASTLYDGTIIDKPITSIKEDNNIIYFDFMGGSDYKTDDNYTSISDFELNERNFYIYGNTIFFLCESENLYIEIFNSNGIMLQNSYINKDENITLPCGIYII